MFICESPIIHQYYRLCLSKPSKPTSAKTDSPRTPADWSKITASKIKSDSAILEILELDQALPPSLSKLYRLNDLLWKHRSDLQQGLWQRERQLLDLPAAVVFYDLTNVHCHGRQNSSLECFGRSKQKRSDCPLVSMVLAINRAGFPCYCEILPGNVAES